MRRKPSLLVAALKQGYSRSNRAASRRWRLLILCLILILSSDVAAFAETSSARLARALLRDITANGAPGAAVAIVSRGKITFVQGFGGTDQDPIRANTRFPIASLTKAFTAAAILQLAEQGRLRLDAPVTAYVPTFRIDAPTSAAAITVRNLLDQRSGLGDAGFPQLWSRQACSLQDRVDELASAKPMGPPGPQFRYFNPNYTILARVVERVSGERYDHYLKAHIFRPLGMSRTFSVNRAEQFEEAGVALAPGHVELFGMPVRRDEGGGFIGGEGGIVSTAADMARWLAMLANSGSFDGIRVLSPASVKLIQTASIGRSYSMGWSRITAGSHVRLQQDGVLTSHSAEAMLIPKERSAALILMNISSVPHSTVTLPQLRQTILKQLEGASDRGGAPPLRVAGLYVFLITLLTIAFCLWDLKRSINGSRLAGRRLGRTFGGAARLTPLLTLAALPKLAETFSGRTFPFEMTVLALLDLSVPLAACGLILGASVIFRAVRGTDND